MRVLLAVAALLFGIAVVIAASAADDPSISVRSDRPAPQQQRQHYYPTTGVPPKIGRAEDLSAPSDAPEPEKTFRRKF